MNCPYCSTAVEVDAKTQKELGKLFDATCENGHKASVAWPDRINEKIEQQ